VTAWNLDLQERDDGPRFSFSRVLDAPLTVPAGGTASVEVDLDPEIGDRWLARREVPNPGSLEIHWDAQDFQGNPFQFHWADRVSH